MALIVNILFSLLSLVLVFRAPNEYSFTYCIIINILFVFQNIFYFLLRRDKNLVCFEFFFMIVFWLTNFVYPVFYYQTNPDFSLFSYTFNVDIITKSTAIAYLGYSFFLLGISSYIKKDKKEKDKKKFIFTEVQFNWLFKLTIVFFGLFIATGGLDFLRNVYSGEGDINEVTLSSYFNILFSISCSLFAMFVFRQNNKKGILFYGFFTLLFLLLLLTTGTRGFIIGVVFILIFMYNSYIKQISSLTLIGGIILGAIILTFIAYGRSDNIIEGNWTDNFNSQAEISSIFDLFGDLVINNRNLYVLVDFADTVQNTYFFGMLSDLVSPIPGLFRFITSMVDIPKELMTGGALPTFLEFGTDSSFGLGTNMVGEAYVTFGLFGVVTFFYLIGLIVKVARNASDYNIYAYVIYYLFVSFIASYPRSSIFAINRNIAWALLLVFILTLIQKKTTSFKEI